MKCKKTFIINRSDIPGCPELSQDFLRFFDSGLRLSCLVGHPGMFLDVLGLFAIFGPGTL